VDSGVSLFWQESDRHRELHPQLLESLAPGEIDGERTGGSPPARTDAVTERRIQIAETLRRVTRIDEGRDPPVAAPAFQPSDVLDRGHGQRAAADDGAALLDAEALEVVAANGQGPAGAEQKLVRHCIRRFGHDRSDLAAQDQHIP